MKFKKENNLFYKGLIKSSFEKINKEYKNALSKTVSANTELIYDNFHVISKGFDECKNYYYKGKKSVPSLFIHIYNFFSEKGFEVDEKDFFDFLKTTSESYYLTYLELFSLSSFVSACCIFELGRICEEKSEGKTPFFAISILRKKSDWDFEKAISSFSPTEKAFVEHEPFFSQMDTPTKNKYRETFFRFCHTQQISEEAAVGLLKTYCEEKVITVGDILFKPEKLPFGLYVLLSAFFVLISTALCILTLGIFPSVLAFPSILLASFSFSDMLMSSKEKPFPSPRLELKSIPPEGKTAVVVSSLIISEKENASLCKDLERFYLQNRDDNIYFTLLLDFPEGKSQQETPKETELKNDLFSRINTLNQKYQNKFTAFVRKREYSKNENTFLGKERKRGAISALINFITDGTEMDYTCGDTNQLRKVKYLFLLDSDTKITFGTVKKMVFAALHPLNKPVVKNGCVIKGYGVFQPLVKFSLVHRKKTEFESFISGNGGIDNYESASYDRFQSILQSGIFCGKGLINVELYKNIVIPNIPDNAVLSHDMPEGNLLRCRLLTDVSVTDEAPTTPLSYFSRLHRWIRGDVQNLIFLKNPHMSEFSDIKVLNNVIRHITPAFSLILLFVFAFLKEKILFAFLFSFLYLLFPFFVTLIFSPFRLFKKNAFPIRRYYSQITGDFTSNVLRLLFEIALIPHYAYTGFNATVKSLYRMFISKKGLLEWVTFKQSENTKNKDALSYYKAFFANLLSGGLLLLSNSLFLEILGAFWIFTPLFLYLSASEKNSEDKITKEEKEKLFYYAEKIWNFFSDNVDARTNYLPPDNVQTAPTDEVAYRTSPTNIGFYLVSCLGACDFGFITKDELKKRLENSFDVIEKLEKKKGHLYNWYDIKNLKVLGDEFISTVDSGNFVTLLVALKEGLLEKGLTDLSKRAEDLINNTDFSYLYNEKKNLFSIGRRQKDGCLEDNCYDLYMSEARTTSYFAVAKGQVSEKHFKTLGRTLITKNGYLGMASWSGTMFEYFMPCLLLPLYKNSFSFEALSFAFHEQKKYSYKKLWGISESGFYAFDSELNYQYKAHGVPSLSLKRYPEGEKIFSPYSSFLTLCINRKDSLLNLERFKKEGVFGQYGFFESIDAKNKAIVKSYMAHHMGMSLIAAANACFDNIFVKRFIADKEMESALELQKERIPKGAMIYKNPPSLMKKEENNLRFFEKSEKDINPLSPQTTVLFSGNLSIKVSDCGTVQLQYRDTPINEADFTVGEIHHSLSCGFIDNHGNIHYATSLLEQDQSCDFSFERGKNYASHVVSKKDFTASVRYSISSKGDCFIVETKGNIKRKYAPFLVFEPQMTKDASFFSSKSFSLMKIRFEYEEESNSLFITSKDASFTVCIQCDKKTEIPILSREHFDSGELFENLDFISVLDALGEKETTSVYPLCLIKALPLSGGECKFYISAGKTKEQSKAICEAERKSTVSSTNQGTDTDPLISSKLSSAFLFKTINYSSAPFSPFREKLWSKGISGDYPIFALYAKDLLERELSHYIKSFTALYRANVKGELFIFFDEEDIYFKKIENALSDIVSKKGGGFLKNRTPGIHLFDREKEKEMFEKRELFCDFVTISNKISENKKEKEISFPTIIRKENLHEENSEDKFLTTEEDGFVFHKNLHKKRRPFSYIMGGEGFGSLCTDSSLGFTFGRNSRLEKITFYDDSPNALRGERVYAFFKDKIYDLCAYSKVFRCKNGTAIYEGEFSGINYNLCVFVSAEKKEKYIIVSFSKEGINSAFSFIPLMGESFSENNPIHCNKKTEKKESFCYFYNSLNVFSKDKKGYCYALGTENTVPFSIPQKNLLSVFAKGQRALFRIGICDIEKEINSISIENALAEKAKSEEFAKRVVPEISFKTDYEDIDRIFPFLFYQTAFSRFYCKTGFYQNGGAFGFRDQLQDCLSLMYSQVEKVREHILNAASHQYLQGDVMHWWHETEKDHMGVRTTCSDDFLWLPFVVAKYVKVTGDFSVLEEKVPFLISAPLETEGEKRENERYEKAVFSKETASLYKHCIKALKRGFSNTKNGICLMGCCDWNDGFSNMGAKGEGLSPFSSRLLIMASKEFLSLKKDGVYSEDEKFILEKSEEMEFVLENQYFINGQYVRCVSDDFAYFGIDETKACKTDILCQAFAVLDGNNEKRKNALLFAYSKLYDEKSKTLRLFYPPFDDSTENGGYINSYPPSIRENAGQYTHAAVWTAIALLKCGEVEKGVSLLESISPFSRCKTKKDRSIYKNEPYVLSADISTEGKGGWSWYTGAASWYSVAVLEHLLGLKFYGIAQNDKKDLFKGAYKVLIAEPKIPFSAVISLCDYTLEITAKKGKTKALLNGAECEFPLVVPEGRNRLELYFE